MQLHKRFLVDLWGERLDDFDWRVRQNPVDLSSLESVCVLHLNDRLGDALVISLMVDALAKARPDLPIVVGTTPAYREYWRRNPRVREVVLLSCSRRNRRGTVRRIHDARRTARPWRGRFGAVVTFEPYAMPDHFALLRTLGARINIGFNKHAYRLFEFSLEERRHGVAATSVAERAARVMEVFGRKVDCRTLDFSVPYGPEDAAAAQAMVDRLPGPGPRLLLNTYGFGTEKHLTPESAVAAVRALRRAGHEGPLYLSVPPEAESTHARALREAGLDENVATVLPTPDFFKLFAFVDRMDAVVSPDTAVGHVAAAFRKPQIVLFAAHGTIPVAWRPYNERCLSVLSRSGADVNDLDWDAFEGAARDLLAEVGEASASSREAAEPRSVARG